MTPTSLVGGADAAPRQRTLGVVVLYHPDPSVEASLRALAAQVDLLLAVDNTPGDVPPPWAAGLGVLPNLRWQALGENRGIAHALALGHRAAVEGACHWVVAFDQDSAVVEGYVARMLAAVKRLPAPERVAMVVPALGGDGLGPGMVEVRRAITAGSVTRVPALDEVGGYRDELFIDYVDFELCIRLRRRGWRIVRDGSVVLGHRIGSPRAVELAGLRLVTTNHAPVRRYYKLRNRMLLLRDHFTAEPLWLTRQFLSGFWEAGKILLMEEQKGEKLAMMARGTIDGLRGRTARFPPPGGAGR